MWIELHQTLPRHPKLLRLANKLRIHPAQAAGHLTFLWLWALDFAPSGDLSVFGPAEISAAACHPGKDAKAFVEALKETGWLDESLQIHDWQDYAGRLIEQKTKDKERKRLERLRMSRGRPPDIPRTSSGCPPLPNPTGPYPTEPDTEITSRSLSPPGGSAPDLGRVIEKIYQAYPRKVAKPDALRAIRRALSRIADPELLRLTRAYASARSTSDPRFTPHPATWFAGNRFLDDPSTWNPGLPYGGLIGTETPPDAGF